MLMKPPGRLPNIRSRIRQHLWYPIRHKMVLLFGSRESLTFTRFVRLPHQCDALVGPVIDYLRPGDDRKPLQIVMFGCSNGAEAYSIASALASRRPDVSFHLLAIDIEEDMIAKASTGRYSRDEVTKSGSASAEFVAATFLEEGESYVVRPELRSRITFLVGDVLDAGTNSGHPPADIVIAQNFLYHLYRKQSRRAFSQLCALLKPRAALLIDGMDIDLRHALTGKQGLRPLDHLIPEIHNDAMARRGGRWPWTYWGLEPLNTARKDWKQRYATIYLRDRTLAAS